MKNNSCWAENKFSTYKTFKPKYVAVNVAMNLPHELHVSAGALWPEADGFFVVPSSFPTVWQRESKNTVLAASLFSSSSSQSTQVEQNENPSHHRGAGKRAVIKDRGSLSHGDCTRLVLTVPAIREKQRWRTGKASALQGCHSYPPWRNTKGSIWGSKSATGPKKISDRQKTTASRNSCAPGTGRTNGFTTSRLQRYRQRCEDSRASGETGNCKLI